MALNQRLELRQGQSLVMTPQLQQAIKLLQMSNIELQAFVDQELERNPLLERDEKSEIQAGPEPQVEAQPDMVMALAANAGAEERLNTLDTELDNVYTHEARADAESRMAQGAQDSGWSSLRPQGALSLNAEDNDFAATLSRQPTLAEHLTGQMNLLLAEPADRLIGQHLIGMLNEDGYLTTGTDAVAETLGASIDHVERVLERLKVDYPGESRNQLRARIARTAKNFAAAFVAAAEELTEEQPVPVRNSKAEQFDFDFFLCQWADAATQRLMDELKSIYAGLPAIIAAKSPDEVLGAVADFATKYRTQTYFEDVPVPPAVIQELEWSSSGTPKKDKWWRYDHLPHEDGRPYVPCARYIYTDDAHILNNGDLVNIWVHIKWVSAITSL